MSERDPVLGVDVGGTFTDVVLVAAGTVTTAKVPTTADQSEAVIEGVETVCERADIDPADVDGFRHGTTVATNALLEGAGARTALVTTEGFGDVLAIGRQNRPALYDHDADRPDPLVPGARRYELDERATTDGIEREPDETALAALVTQLREAVSGDAGPSTGRRDGPVESVAVSLLHAYAHPETEQRVTERLREALDVPVVASHETLPEFREYERTATTAVDASVTPVVRRYLDALVDRVRGRGLVDPAVVQSNGGIADVATVRERAVTTVLSGPAAGVVGGALFDPDDCDGVVTFDMGGTSSDVGLVREGTVERTTEATVGGHPVGLSMVDIETVGAGGGSVAWVDDGGALRVGPRSAGARPGPACYGLGGEEPTVTDAAVVCGYLGPETTLGEELDLDVDAAEAALAELAAAADLAGPVAAARGVRRVANATMSRAIRRVTLERGHDPRGLALVAFGGAGPMHAAGLAGRLGIDTVVVPTASGVCSALGMLAADERHDTARTHRTPLAAADTDTVTDHYEQLVDRALAETSDPDRARVEHRADLRYAGQSHELTVPVREFDPDRVAERFHEAHERRRGYRLDEPVDLLTLRVTATVPGDPPPLGHDGTRADPVERREVSVGGAFHETPVYDRRLPAGATVEGPAVVAGGESTIVVPPDWRVTVDDRATLRLDRGEAG
jgi:N-methylhydantoinase A